MVMKVVKEDISKILARAEITESTQWLSAKKRKRGVYILKSFMISFTLLNTKEYFNKEVHLQGVQDQKCHNETSLYDE